MDASMSLLCDTHEVDGGCLDACASMHTHTRRRKERAGAVSTASNTGGLCVFDGNNEEDELLLEKRAK